MQEGLDPSQDELRGFPLESRALLSLRPEVRMEGEVLIKGQHESVRLVVPTSPRYRLFQMTHADPTAAHLGPLKTTLQLHQSYYWRGMKRDVADWYRQCDECAKGKGPPPRPHGHLQKIQVGAPSIWLSWTFSLAYLQLMMALSMFWWSWMPSLSGLRLTPCPTRKHPPA